MSLLKRNLKVFLSLIGITANVTAQTQQSSVRMEEKDPIEVNASNDTQLHNYQVVSQEELVDAIQANNLEQLLLKKGVLIQKQSAEATVCQKCNSGN